jgi:hypothetical protein
MERFIGEAFRFGVAIGDQILDPGAAASKTCLAARPRFEMNSALWCSAPRTGALPCALPTRACFGRIPDIKEFAQAAGRAAAAVGQ